jgi:hypothetical protein
MRQTARSLGLTTPEDHARRDPFQHALVDRVRCMHVCRTCTTRRMVLGRDLGAAAGTDSNCARADRLETMQENDCVAERRRLSKSSSAILQRATTAPSTPQKPGPGRTPTCGAALSTSPPDSAGALPMSQDRSKMRRPLHEVGLCSSGGRLGCNPVLARHSISRLPSSTHNQDLAPPHSHRHSPHSSQTA